MERLLQDLRHAFRGLRRSPGFAAAAVLMLAVGIGGNAAVFSIVNALLLRPLPYRDADRLVWIWSTRTDRDKAFFSIPNFLDTRDRTTTLEEMAALANWSANLTGNGEPERLQGIRLTPNGCRMLGIAPVAGRGLSPDDARPGSPHVVLLSHGLWKRRFGGDAGIVGRTAFLSGEGYVVAGILPPHFLVPGSETDIVVPLDPATDPRREERGSNFLRVIARLRPGATREQARDDLAEITRGLARDYPEPNGKLTAPRVLPLQEEVVGGYRLALLMLSGAVALVLIIACSNVSGLLIARAAGRRKELSVRAALGAGRLDLARQLLAESGLLAIAGGGLGLLLAWWSLDLLLSAGRVALPRAGEIALDARILAFTLVVSIGSGLLFGLTPAVRASRIDLMESLRKVGAGGRPGGRMRDLLVVWQVALSIVLLVGVGLLAKSLMRLQEVSPGFEARGLLAVRLSLPAARYPTPDGLRTLYDRLERDAAALPGVASVGAASVMPLSGMNVRADFTIVGRPGASPRDIPAAQNRWVSPGYLATMRIPILRGRSFTAHDDARGAAVVIVDETLARLHWPGRDPIGEHILIDDAGGAPPREAEIVGVAGSVKHFGLDDEPTGTVYTPFYQVPQGALSFLTNNLTLVVRAANDPAALTGAVRRLIGRADPEVAASSVRTMEETLSASVAARRFNMTLLGVFAAAALLLAAFGLHALVSFSVVQRTPEIALRMALGARPLRLLRAFVGQGLRLAILGSALGLGAAWLLTRLFAGLLYGVAPTDGATFLAAPVVLAATAALATYLPARRASRVDPASALRGD